MRLKRAKHLEILSISALDLFASSLAVFMIIAVFLFPFYLKSPAVDAALSRSQAALGTARTEMRTSKHARDTAQARVSEASARVQTAKANNKAANEDFAIAGKSSRAATLRPGARSSRAPSSSSLFSVGDLDVVFIMDTTGSMRDEISDIQRSLLSIIRILEKLAPSLRIGFVAFKDYGDAYVTQAYPLSPMSTHHRSQIAAFVRSLRARGGGDDPEPVHDAIRSAVGMSWRLSALSRIVVISDAPTHRGGWQEALRTISNWRKAAPPAAHGRTLSAIFTGRDPAGLRFYQQLVAAGGGNLVDNRRQLMASVLLSILDGSRPNMAGTTR